MLASDMAQGVAARECPDVQLQVARSRPEREAAFRLIYNAYVRSGLCEPNRFGFRFTPHQMLPTTDILIAKIREEVICTLSLARDGELGLPMEDLYAEEVAQRRASGIQLAEVTCLADRRSNPRRFFATFCDLSRLMVQLAEKSAIDQILVAVHPRHAALYRRYMAFTQIGERRDYSKVQGNPAVALCLDLNQIRVNRPPRWDQFFGEQLPDEVLQHQPISSVEREYFERTLSHERYSETPLDDSDFPIAAADDACSEQDAVEASLLCV